ncbi:MAG: flagellar biosynthesis protein FlhA [Bdellovibrionota bacterium]
MIKQSARVVGRIIGQLSSSDTFLSLAVVGLLVMMLVPLSPFMLDFFLAASISASLGILLMAVYNKQSSDFTVFPTALLLVTLFRLALNVASTRLILSNGKGGSKAAGELIAIFGDIVIHGNTFVGVLVFVILNVINFIVITKGAGRISEVSARFMLDSLPGKQMSIDADLKSGAITPEEAQGKRVEIDQQADFYGAMDGASKFVKGDAIAGLVITGVNILGGLFVGIGQESLSFSEAIKTYTLLTIGDGLVTQFPALIVSTAAGIVVTKASSSKRALGEDFAIQLMANPRIFFLLSGILFVLGIFLSAASPAFWSLSFLTAMLGYWSSKKAQNLAQSLLKIKVPTKSERGFKVSVGLGLAHQLSQDSHLQLDLDRFVTEMKEKGAELTPKISICDASDMGLFEYSFYTPEGIELYSGKLREREFYLIGNEQMLDFDPSLASDPLLSRPCQWVSAEQRDEYVQRGFVVVSAAELFRWHLFLAYRRMLKGTDVKRTFELEGSV